MSTKLRLHEGIISPSLVAELEAFRAPGQRVSSYYLNVNAPARSPETARLAVKDFLADQQRRLEQLDLPHPVRSELRRDVEQVRELALETIGQRPTRALTCFVASEAGRGWAFRLPWPVRDRAFFEDHFVLWPLQLLLDQADRYGIVLTDKENARLFLFFLEQIEEVADVQDVVPGRVRFPDPLRQVHYQHKHIEHFHHHFAHVAEAALRLYERRPFQHLIVGGRWETLPQFESHLHRYLTDRVIVRWEIDVRAPTLQVQERTRQEEQRFLQRQAQEIWKGIQDQRTRRGALGPDEVFAALWQRRAQALLVEPDVVRPGFRCSVCGRLQRRSDLCVECGGKLAEIADVHEEAVHDAVEQSAQVRYWKDPALSAGDSLAALRRF